MRRIDIDVSLECEALFTGTSQFLPISEPDIKQYHLEAFQLSFLDFVLRCLNCSNSYGIKRINRLGPVDVSWTTRNNVYVRVKCVLYTGFDPASKYDNPSSDFEIGMIDMNDCPYFDYSCCYGDFKHLLKKGRFN